MFGCGKHTLEWLQKEVFVVGTFIINTTYRIPVILQAFFNSQLVNHFHEGFVGGFNKINQVVVTTLGSSDAEMNLDEAKEEKTLLKTSILTNTIYYTLPVVFGLGIQNAITCIPYVRNSAVESIISSIKFTADCYFFTRRTFDNALYMNNLMRSNADSLIRKSALKKFDKILPGVCFSLTRILAREETSDNFRSILFNELQKSLRKYFIEPELFRNVKYKKLEIPAIKAITTLFLNDKLKLQYATPIANAQSLATIIVKLLFIKLIPHFKKSPIDFLSLLTQEFEKIKYKFAKDIAQDLLNVIEFHCYDQNSAVSNCCDCAPHPLFNNQQKCVVEPDSPFLSVLRYLSEIGLVILIRKYFGSLAIIATAQMYGRRLLELQMSEKCLDRREKILSGNKMLAIGLGLPIALIEDFLLFSTESFFVADAIINMLLHIWTLAELKNKSTLILDSTSRDYFWFATVPREFLYWLGSSLTFKPNKPIRTVALMKDVAQSKELHWILTLILGDFKKIPRPRWVNDTFSVLLKHGLSTKLIQIEHPNVVHVILNQVPSVQDFIRLNGNDIAYVIKYAKLLRAFRPWLFSPLLSLLQQNLLVSLMSIGLHLLKEEDLFKLFEHIHAAIDNSKKEKLTAEEQHVITEVEDLTQRITGQHELKYEPPLLSLEEKNSVFNSAPFKTNVNEEEEDFFEIKNFPPPQPFQQHKENTLSRVGLWADKKIKKAGDLLGIKSIIPATQETLKVKFNTSHGH